MQAIVANKFFPGLLDRYLAKTGYSGQLTQEPAEIGRADNLFDPVPGDPDTHGRFDTSATAVSPQLWATEHRGAVLAVGLAVAGVIATIVVGTKPLARQNR